MDITRHNREEYNRARVAQMYFRESKSQKEIANTIHWSPSKVNRTIAGFKSGEDDMVKVYIKAPKCVALEKELIDKLGHNVTKVRITSGVGKFKNLKNVSVVGAECFIESLISMLGNKKKICIYISCGSTTREVIDWVIYSISNNTSLLEELKGADIEIYPTAIFAGFQVTQILPIFGAMTLAQGLKEVLNTDNIKVYSSSLPENLKDITDDKEKEIILKHYGFSVFYPKEEYNNLFLFGVGSVKDPSYVSLANKMGVDGKVLDNLSDKQAEINYQPFLTEGKECERCVPSANALKISELRKLSKLKNNTVIIVFGGNNKIKIAKSALKVSDYYNVLCTDSEIVDEIMRF